MFSWFAIVFKWQLAMYMYMYIYFYILAFLKFVLIARKEFNKYHFGGGGPNKRSFNGEDLLRHNNSPGNGDNNPNNEP